MKQKSRFCTARRILIFWTLFIGLGAVAGALAMLLDPSGKSMGMDTMLPYFQVLPFADVVFQDFTFSGWALLIVNGLTNLTAAGLLLAKKHSGVVLGGVFGVTLMLWICIQFYMFPPNFMSTTYFFFGLAQAATGYAAWVFEKQEAFRVYIFDYPDIGTGAAVYEITATERTEGTPGFWWCGRFGMHKWPMPIAPIGVDVSRYAHVTICSPIWVFALAAPVRSVCMEAAGKIKDADYILVHHQNSVYENAAEEMDELLGITHTALRSVRCREGTYKCIKGEKR